MSKLLKFIVNLFLIAAILVAAAILVPMFAGVMTTIVDTPSMDTNLPLGSITYSTNVDVNDLKPGDEVLKDSDTSTYAYILRSCDPDSGEFSAVSVSDPAGREEKIILRNSVPKVAVMVPYIGYVMIAMHSLEGIIIIALVVVLMIILFVLSELWKPRDDDEEEEGEDVNAVIAAGLDPDDQSGIDTDTIKAAVKDNIEAVNRDPDEEVPMTRAQKRAAKKARKLAEKEAKAAGRKAEETPAPAAKEEAAPAAAAAPAAEAAPAAAAEAVPSDQTGNPTNTAGVALFGNEGDTDLFRFDAAGNQDGAFAEPHVSDVVSAVEQVMAGVGTGEDRVPDGTYVPEEPEVLPENGELKKVRRPSLDEIMETARAAGENPKVKRDDNTGVTVVDFTDVL
ncbi:MAG: hypothetical protein J6E44_07990 [Lachnospiraceae bacterium]|nr:hypothetical protein [Lachnospiraceae bacterium]